MRTRVYGITAALMMVFSVCPARAVTSVITRHNSGADFLKGTPDETVITSDGTIRLAPKTAAVDTGGRLSAAWSIHTMIRDDDGAIYLGTGPDAAVLRYADGMTEQVYPPVTDETAAGDANSVDTTIRNEHVFAMANDVSGRLLIGVSGSTGRLVRLGDAPEVVFEDPRVRYIFAIAQDADNNVYLGTGPEGLVFRLNAFCRNPEVIYDAQDTNILSLLVRDGRVYAGSDQRGLIYRIDPALRRATVLYDSDQDEVASLRLDGEGNLYAAVTSAAAAMSQLQVKGMSLTDAPGRVDTDPPAGDLTGGAALNTANSEDEDKDEAEPQRPSAMPKPPMPKGAGHIYKITPDGFVTDVFSEVAVFYAMVEFDGRLWLGTGNRGQLYTVDPATEEKAVYYTDETSSQVTSLLVAGETLYAGLSNPARLIRIERGFQPRGVYTSDLIDAGQPARWGKLQLEATIPAGGRVLMAARSGNVGEPNDPTFSDWTDDVAVTAPTDLNCPTGRFCQYRLTLTSPDAAVTPTIREVAVASVVPNLPPKVRAIKLQRSRDKQKPFIQQIGFSAADANNDTLTYTLEFRRAGRTVWIPLKKDLEETRFEWDSRTVEDGRYEVRVTADDYKSNSPTTALTGSRISDPVVIDNTPPAMIASTVTVTGPVVRMALTVEDAWTVLGKVRYTVDSADDWRSTLPTDGIYDTRREEVVIEIDDLAAGDHVIAVELSDDLGNTGYQTFEVTIP